MRYHGGKILDTSVFYWEKFINRCMRYCGGKILDISVFYGEKFVNKSYLNRYMRNRGVKDFRYLYFTILIEVRQQELSQRTYEL